MKKFFLTLLFFLLIIGTFYSGVSLHPAHAAGPSSWTLLLNTPTSNGTDITVTGQLLNPGNSTASIFNQPIEVYYATGSASSIANSSGTELLATTDTQGNFSATIYGAAQNYNKTYWMDAEYTDPSNNLATSNSVSIQTNPYPSGVRVTYTALPKIGATSATFYLEIDALPAPDTFYVILTDPNNVTTIQATLVQPDSNSSAIATVSFPTLAQNTTFGVSVQDENTGQYYPMQSITTGVATPPASLNVEIPELGGQVSVTQTTASFNGTVDGDGKTAVSVQAIAVPAAGQPVTGNISGNSYSGTPPATGTPFPISFQNLQPGTTYTAEVIDSASSQIVSNTVAFTTSAATGTNTPGGTTAGNNNAINISSNYQTSAYQSNAGCTENSNSEYCMLAPIPFPGVVNGKINVGTGVGTFIAGIIQFAIALAGLLAFVMLIYAGIQYATTEAFSGKSRAKEHILNALIGLVLALGSYIILNTINPALVSPSVSLAVQNLQVTEADGLGIQTPAGNSQNTSTTGGNAQSAPAITITSYTNPSDQIAVKPCDPSTLTTITFLGQSLQIEKDLVSNLNTINQEWIANGGNNWYNVTSVGGYACRTVTNQPADASIHAYGLAIDINPAANPYSASGTLTTNLPPAFVQLFTNQGWGWGGNWTSLKDPMHFSKYIPEGGNQKF